MACGAEGLREGLCLPRVALSSTPDWIRLVKETEKPVACALAFPSKHSPGGELY